MSNQTYNPTNTAAVEFTENVERFKFVGFDGKKCGAGELALGITEHEYNSGDKGSVVLAQSALLKIKQQLEAGTLLASDGEGDGVEATSGDYVNAILRSGCGTNDFNEVILTRMKL